MVKPKVKICGNHQLTDLDLLYKYDNHIDYIGFIFTTISKRYISPSKVAEWLKKYPALTEKAVAVFLNQELAEVKEILRVTKIDTVQLHGQESVDYCQKLKREFAQFDGRKLKLWKVIPVEEGQVASYNEYLQVVDTLLLDTKIKGAVGGTGQPFEWSVIAEVLQQTKKYALPLLVAGGITSDNITELLRIYAVDGVDLAGGVETELAKDEQKLVKLIEGVKRVVQDQI